MVENSMGKLKPGYHFSRMPYTGLKKKEYRIPLERRGIQSHQSGNNG